MKAINILRGFLSKSPSAVYPDEVLEFVDAIENELKKFYIEGPKGADGSPVRYGGYVKVYPYDGSKRKVKAIRCSGFGWKAIFEDGGEEPVYRVVSCEPPTVEDVLNELCLEHAKAWDGEATKKERQELVARYAKRLQLREDD